MERPERIRRGDVRLRVCLLDLSRRLPPDGDQIGRDWLGRTATLALSWCDTKAPSTKIAGPTFIAGRGITTSTIPDRATDVFDGCIIIDVDGGPIASANGGSATFAANGSFR